MSCTVLNGILKDCEPNRGGIRRLWLVRMDNVDSIAIVDGLVTAVNIIGTGFKEYVCPPNSTSYDIQFSADSTGVIEYNHTINFRISRRIPSKNAELLALAEGRKDMLAIVLDFNDQYWILGWDAGLELDTLDGGSGTSIGDGSNYQLALTGKQVSMELPVNADEIGNVIPGNIIG